MEFKEGYIQRDNNDQRDSDKCNFNICFFLNVLLVSKPSASKGKLTLIRKKSVEALEGK